MGFLHAQTHKEESCSCQNKAKQLLEQKSLGALGGVQANFSYTFRNGWAAGKG